MNRKILITGATGMIGGELALKLMETDSVFCLIRGVNQEAAVAKAVARGLTKASVVHGDLTDPQLQLPSGLDLVIHAGAETSFNQDEKCQDTNIKGTSNLLEGLKAVGFTGVFTYISTACNVGEVSNACLKEDDGCLPNNRHHNSYTLSKAHAEILVRESGVNFLVIRPSVVMSAGIENTNFAKQILWFAPLLQKFSSLPLLSYSRLDVIPVDFLVSSILGLVNKQTPLGYNCYNISAGNQAQMLKEWKVEIEQFYPPTTPLSIVDSPAEMLAWDVKSLKSDAQKRIFQGLKYYLPFFNMNAVFDNARLEGELGTLNVPKISTYLSSVFRQLTEDSSLREAASP